MRKIGLVMVGLGLCARTVFAQGGGDTLNHSFTVDVAAAIVCLDGARFVGGPTQASSLNLSMVAQVFDAPAFTGSLAASGNSHTFTSVAERFTFEVRYSVGTFGVGQSIALSASDIPGTHNGAQGFESTTDVFVQDCRLDVPAPAMGRLPLAASVILLAGAGVWLRRRQRASR